MANLKIKVSQEGAKETGGILKGLWGDIALGNIATDALRKGLEFLKTTIIDSTKATAEQRNADIALSNAVGGSIVEYKKFANSLMETIAATDDHTQNIMALAKSYGYHNSQIEEATKKAYGLAESLKVSEEMGLKAYKLALDGNIEGLKRLSPEFRHVTTQQEALSVINKRAETGWQTLIDKSNTYEGLQKRLNNAFDESKESLGLYVELIGKDFYQSMLNSTKAIGEFLSQSENVGKVGGTWEVIKKVFSSLGEMMKGSFFEAFDMIKASIGNFVKSLTDLIPVGFQNISVFDILGGAIKTVGIVFGIMIKSVALFISQALDLRTALVESIKLIVMFGEALFNPQKWQEVGKQLELTKESFVKFGTNLVDNAGKIITDTVNEFKKLPTESKKISTDLSDAFKKGFDEAKKDADNFNNGITEGSKTATNNVSDNALGMAEKIKNAFSQVNTFLSGTLKGSADVMNSIFDLIGQQFDQQLANVTSFWEESNNQANTAYELQKELIENDGMTKEENLNKQLADAKSKGDKEKAAEIRKQLDLMAADKQYKAAIEANTKKQAEEEKKIKSQMFEAEKAQKISEIWVNAATGVVSAWASGAGWPGPSMIAGMALAGVLTALILATAGIQTGIIANQKNPYAAAEGGVFPGNESQTDNMLSFVRSGEAVFQPEDYKTTVSTLKELREGRFNTETNQGITINISQMILQGVENFDSFKDKVKEAIISIAIEEGARA